MRGWIQDIRQALRSWRQRPGFAAVVIVTLALGIGANTAIFSVVNGVLLEPLPYRDADRLVTVYSQFPSMEFYKFWLSAPEYTELRRWSETLSEVGAYRTRSANLTGGDRPLRVRAATASASLFTVLGVDAELGRPYDEREDLPGAEAVVVLGHGLWQQAFGADPEILGRTVQVDGAPRTVVGVMPPGFDVDDEGVEAWIPLALDPAEPGGRANHYLNLVARLADGAGLAQARQEIAGLIERWERELPDTHTPHPEFHPLVVASLKEERVGGARPALALLAGAVGLVLLIACANVANLLLARTEGRQKEIAVRTALGAGRKRLLRQFFVESLLLSLAGGAVGVLLARLGLTAVLAANPQGVARAQEIALDGRALAFTLAVTLATGLLFAVAPLLHSRARAFAVLKEGGRTTAGRGRRTVRRVLVVAEVALAALLVMGAGLLLRSFWTLQQVDPGFDPQGALTFQLSLPPSAYPEPPQVADFYGRLMSELSAQPGVESVTAMTGLPPVRDLSANDTEFENLEQTPDGPAHNVDYYQFVTAGYFEAMGIELLDGRVFTGADANPAAPTVIVNQTLAHTFWPDRRINPIGQRLRPPGDEMPWFTIVGIVEDVKQGGLDRPAGTELYFLSDLARMAGFPLRTQHVVVRTGGNPLAMADGVRQTVRRLDPALPVANLEPLAATLSAATARPRFLALLVGLFAAVALLLAAVGTYGVLSYGVEQRRHEMGVRLALGAQARSLLGLVLAQGMGLAALGLALGLAGAFALRRLLASQLYGVDAADPITFFGVATLLAAVALAACALPARRATRVDPIETLRVE